MVKERRCNLFDDNGKPRRLKDGTMGCFRDASACRFAHPHEREWRAAHPSPPPRHGIVTGSYSDFHYTFARPERVKESRDREREKERERDRDRDRTGGKERNPDPSYHPEFPRRKDSTTTTSTSLGPPSRRSTFDSTMDVSGTTKRGRSPAFSASSGQLDRLRKDDKHCTQELSPLDRDSAPSTSHRSRTGSKSGDTERAEWSYKMPQARHHIADSRDVDNSRLPSPLPPEPPKPPPVQPPPPPPPVLEAPKLPSVVSNQPTSPAETASRGPKELSMEEQRSAWHERIDLMFTSITSRRDYAKLESDLSEIRLLSDSPLANGMPEADRARINAQKMTLELQMEVKRKEVNEAIQRLIWSSFWPVLRVPQILEMEKTIEEVKKHVLEVRSLSDDVKSGCETLLKTSASDCTQDSDRPAKRRKLEGGVDSPGQSRSGITETTTEDTAGVLEALRDELIEHDRHLIDLENDIYQRDQIVTDEVELLIDARLKEEDGLYPPVMEPTEVSQIEIEAVVDARNQELVRTVAATGEEIGVLAVEVAELITKVNDLEARCMALDAENQEFKNKLAQGTLEHAKIQDALVRREKEIDAIAATLQAYISQAPAGQTSNHPTAEYVVESLDSQLEGLFREKFCVALTDIQRQVFDKVRESHARTLDIISPKIMLLLRMVDLITARVGKFNVDAVNPG